MSLTIRILLFLYVVLSLSIFPMTELGSITTNIIVPFALLCVVPYSILRQNIDSFIVAWILFLLWGSIVSIDSIDSEVAFTTQKRLVMTIAYSFVVYVMVKTSIKYFKSILNGFIVSSIIIMGYALYNSGDIDLYDTSRIEFLGINANSYGYFAFIACVSMFYKYSIGGRTRALLILSIIISIVSLYVVTLSASRGGFIILLLTIFVGYVLILNPDRKWDVKQLLYTIVYVAVFYSIYTLVYGAIADSYLANRFQTLQLTETSRQYHMVKAYQIGVENFWTGVGGGNYSIIPKEFELGSFSHNTVLEAFANYGIFGPILLLWIYYIAMNAALKMGTSLRVLTASFIVIHFVYGLLYVTYLSIEFMGILFMMHACSISSYKLLGKKDISREPFE